MLPAIKPFITVLFCIISSISTFAHADETFLTDLADSTDFEAFHKSDNENKKTPSLKKRIEAAITGEAVSTNTQTQTAPQTAVRAPNPAPNNSLIASGTLSKDATQTINSLYQTMNKHCSNGWIKHGEWTQKDVTQGSYILQFEYSCQ